MMTSRQRKNANVVSDNKKSKKNDKQTTEKLHEDQKEKPRSKEGTPPMYRFTWKKVLIRILLSIALMYLAYLSSKKNDEKVFASRSERIQHKSILVPCSSDYKEAQNQFKGCTPVKCGRFVTDVLVSPEESGQLLRIAQKGMSLGRSNGGASILDLHSGALSQRDSFIDIYKYIKSRRIKDFFSEEDILVYKNVKDKVQKMISYEFAVPADNLYLTHPTFFSEITHLAPQTIHDEYWHVHVDKETYPSFYYTSLVYLSNHGIDFEGGRFLFVDKPQNITIEPRIGRVSGFTSGSENPHFVEKVTKGTRYALTISFTCDKNFAIEDPMMLR